MARHVMTARRRAALRKAQLISARRRKGRKMSRKQKRLVTGGVLVGMGGLLVARHIVTGSRFTGSYKKVADAKHNPLREYLGYDKKNKQSITRPMGRWKTVSVIRDYYGPGNMVGVVFRGKHRIVSGSYTHVHTYRDWYLLSRARQDKAYIKKQNKVDRQFKKTVKGL